jgi:Phage integrase, N-terminal SAM-like domain
MTTAALVPVQPAFTDSERLALAGYLAGYRSLTREAYALDLRQFNSWCRTRSLALFAVRRADIEGFARELEARGRARATVTRRLSTIARRAGSPSPSPRTRCGTRLSPPRWMPGSRCATCRKPPPMRTRGPRCDTTWRVAAWTGTRLILSPPTPQAPPDSRQRAAVPPGGPPPSGGQPQSPPGSAAATRRNQAFEREPPLGTALRSLAMPGGAHRTGRSGRLLAGR